MALPASMSCTKLQFCILNCALVLAPYSFRIDITLWAWQRSDSDLPHLQYQPVQNVQCEIKTISVLSFIKISLYLPKLSLERTDCHLEFNTSHCVDPLYIYNSIYTYILPTGLAIFVNGSVFG